MNTMNDARRQLMHEAFKLVDLVIMIVAFVLAVWISLPNQAPEVPITGTDKSLPAVLAPESPGGEPAPSTMPDDGISAPESAPPMSSPQAAQVEKVAPEASGSFLVDWWRNYRQGLDHQEGVKGQEIDRVEAVLQQITVQNVLFVMALLVAWHAAFKSRNLYNSRRLDSTLVEVLDVLRAGLVATLMVSAIATPVLSQHLPIDQVDFTINFFLFGVGTTVVARVLMRYVLEQARLRGRNLRAMLIVGTNHRALRFAKAIGERPELGYYVVGFVDEEWDGIAGFKKGGYKLEASLKDLGTYVSTHVVDEVVVALPVSSAYIYSSRIISLCQEQGLTVRFWSQIFDSRLAKGRLDIFDNEPMLSLEGTSDESLSILIKKLFDRSVAAVLLAMMSPLFLLVASAIKLTSKGPVFFVQNRMGLNKRLFPVFKFRTMVEDAEARLKDLEHLNEVSGPVFKLEKDPRLTPIGDFLRRTSIDELPQLINVLRGDMSLVGPRPLPERDYQGFDTDAHRRRLSVRPGITCTWQVSGRNSIPFEQWMKMDLDYIDNWSLWSDFKILLQTIPVVLGPLLFFRRGEFMKGKKSDAKGQAPEPSAGDDPASPSAALAASVGNGSGPAAGVLTGEPSRSTDGVDTPGPPLVTAEQAVAAKEASKR